MADGDSFELSRREMLLAASGAAILPAAAWARVSEDMRKAPNGTVLEGDICIIGAGPAGIAIARRLAPTGARILLFESGGRTIEEATQNLYAGDNIGLPYFDLDVTRLRFLGGSSNHWGNQVSDFEPIDFKRRPWIPHSGWPIARSDLDAYYPAAFEYLDLGAFDLHDRGLWLRGTKDFQVFDPKGTAFTSKLFRRRDPSLAVGEFYFDWLTVTPNVHLFMHANATRVALAHDGNAVSHIDLATLDGKKFKAKARAYVVACGGLENPRLLLASNDVQKRGVGNGSDLVGRYFMDHLRIESGVLRAPEGVSLTAYDEYEAAEYGRSAAIYIRPEHQRREQISVYRLKFIQRDPGELSMGYRGAKGLILDGVHGKVADMGTHVARVVLDPGGAAHGLAGKLRGEKELVCVNVIEQTPNPASRVTLSNKRDALGMQRINLDWQLGEIERRTLFRAQRLLQTQFSANGLGTLEMEVKGEDEGWTGVEKLTGSQPSTRFEAGHHHSGTTRMGSDPKSGVVDRDCKVFGVGNLFMAGSSVFPTLGSANPTCTISALAIRLADHLKPIIRS